MMPWLRKYGYYLFSIWELLTGIENPWLIIKIFAGRAGTAVNTVRLRRTKLSFKVRGAMDVWSIKETFLDRFYERCGFVIQTGWTVIDVGAGLGDFSLFAAQVSGTRILAFEPFPESFNLLTNNASLNKAGNITLFSEAVGAEHGPLLLDLAGGEPLQFRSRNAPVTQPENQIAVKARSLSNIIQHTGQGGCDLLKMDCEGAEYDILMKSSPEVLGKIRRIVMEYHDGVTSHSHDDLIRFLRSQGYTVQAFDNPVHKNIGYLSAER